MFTLFRAVKMFFNNVGRPAENTSGNTNCRNR